MPTALKTKLCVFYINPPFYLLKGTICVFRLVSSACQITFLLLSLPLPLFILSFIPTFVFSLIPSSFLLSIFPVVNGRFIASCSILRHYVVQSGTY